MAFNKNNCIKKMGEVVAIQPKVFMLPVFYRYCELMDVNSMLHFLFHYSMRWLSLRLDVLSVLINTVTALFVILFKGDLPTAYAGLALAYSAQVRKQA